MMQPIYINQKIFLLPEIHKVTTAVFALIYQEAK
jgi:hypothetical protein